MGGRETILLVDDKNHLRRLAKTMLERMVYKVLEAGNTRAAILFAEKFEDTIRKNISDPTQTGHRCFSIFYKLSSLSCKVP